MDSACTSSNSLSCTWKGQTLPPGQQSCKETEMSFSLLPLFLFPLRKAQSMLELGKRNKSFMFNMRLTRMKSSHPADSKFWTFIVTDPNIKINSVFKTWLWNTFNLNISSISFSYESFSLFLCFFSVIVMRYFALSTILPQCGTLHYCTWQFQEQQELK